MGLLDSLSWKSTVRTEQTCWWQSPSLYWLTWLQPLPDTDMATPSMDTDTDTLSHLANTQWKRLRRKYVVMNRRRSVKPRRRHTRRLMCANILYIIRGNLVLTDTDTDTWLVSRKRKRSVRANPPLKRSLRIVNCVILSLRRFAR